MNGNKFLSVLSKLKSKLNLRVIFILLFSSYIIANTFNLSKFGDSVYDVENNSNINLIYFLSGTAVIFLIFLILHTVLRRIKNFHRYILFFSSVIFAVGLVANKSGDIAYNITVLAVLLYIINYCFKRNDETGETGEEEQDVNADGGISLNAVNRLLNFRTLTVLISVIVIAYIAAIGYACILRHKIFWSHTFDFGIFAQMFENMAKTGLQITSVERNAHLSHFTVHFSPFYYVILPFYMIFRTPESLLVIQAAAIAAGAFPLALIAKKFNLGSAHILLIVLTYLFYPSLTAGAFWDFHENKFLTVLILWLLYFILSCFSGDSGGIKKYIKYIFVYVFAALVLTVKEDSFIYVLCIAAYIISMKKDGGYVKKNIAHGLIIMGLSFAYFSFAAWYLGVYGEGTMTWRFSMFMRGNERQLTSIILNILKSPALLLASLISVPEKLEFLFYMLIPLCFLPFVSKKLNFVFLIAPMLIINLVMDWSYQYNIDYQYTYGVTALLFFLAVQNLSKLNVKYITKICVAMACFSLVLFSSKNYGRVSFFYTYYSENQDSFTETAEMLKQIPMDASVSSTTYILPHLVQRENVYMVDMKKTSYFDYGTDYLVNDIRYVNTYDYANLRREIARHGYIEFDSNNIAEIFIKSDTADKSEDTGG